MKLVDMTGQRFGRLTAIRRSDVSKWLFSCECGQVKAINGKNVRRGLVTSCGCVRRETMAAIGRSTKTHGQSQETAEYRAWKHARQRCADQDNSCYGGRGIKMCQKWEQSFEAFFADVGVRPSPRHSIDRYPDNDGDYEPGNVRWANRKEQARNTRSNHLVNIGGDTVTLAEAIEVLGLKSSTVRQRLAIGWSEERALA